MLEFEEEGHSSAEGWEEANSGKTICENSRGLAIEGIYSTKRVYQFVK